ncbi:GntR family transcriptional regulator [Glycomyces dulcitolivorans]|uniref:GntR family transcriptional regulator n=1 Tax=Glycomyces dulcitolivorans TaxID=2200759 RepID=UPI000DD3C962|nr:GntR family transcriptional regulator [Glycomyces dulcitolivorans]
MDPDAAIDHDALMAPYQQLAAILRARIDRGDWQPGRRILSEAQLVQSYGVARGTVRRAVQLLADEGRVVAIQGHGTFVAAATDNTE